MLTIGTGIGGGLILGGEIYRGASGAGAELGHVVIAMDGLPCQGNCPGRGCVETYASGTAHGPRRARAAGREPDSALGRMLAEGREIDGRAVTELALAGDADRDRRLRPGRLRLGVGLTSFANIFEPEVFVIGGGVIAAGDLLLEPARRELRARALPPMRDTPVVAAEMGEDAGMIGAAAMARIELERRTGGLMPGELIVCPTRSETSTTSPPAGPRCAGLRRLHRLRGHPPDGRPARQARDPAGAAAGLQPRGQRSGAGDRARAADRARGHGGAGLRRRHARDLRPRLPPDPPLHRARPRGHRPARPVGRAGRPGRLRPSDRPLALRGLPAEALGEMERVLRSDRDRRRLRAPAPDRREPGGAGGDRPRPPGRGLPRADQDARGDLARLAGRTGAALPRRRKGGDRAGHRPRLLRGARPGRRLRRRRAPPPGPVRRPAAGGGQRRRRPHRDPRQRPLPGLDGTGGPRQ